MKDKLFNNKLAKGLISLLTIIILMCSILATSIYYQNNITANAIRETKIDNKNLIQIKEVNDINELNQLNEGFYQIKNGRVFYLEHFDSYLEMVSGF